MLDSMLNNILCPVCEESTLSYSNALTYGSYVDGANFNIDDIDKFINSVVNEYIVFECSNCNYAERYVFKDIERLIRNKIKDRVLMQYASGNFISKVIPSEVFVLKYCGYCNGYDGKGSCPVEFYNKCDIRKII